MNAAAATAGQIDPAVMLQEAAALAGDLRSCADPFDDRVHAALSPEEWRAVQRVYVIGDGDSYHAALAAEMAFESCGVATCRPMSALRFLEYGAPALRPGDRERPLVIAVSVSGATPRVLQAVERAREHGALTLALTGTATSPLAERAGRSVAVELAARQRSPGIRTYQASLVGLFLIAARLGETRARDRSGALRRAIAQLCDAVEATVETIARPCADLVEIVAAGPATVVAGSGPSYGTARHAAAKLVEAAGLTANPQDLEEWWHVDRFAHATATPLIIIAPPGRAHWRAVELAASARALGRHVIAVTHQSDSAMARHARAVLPVTGHVSEELSPLLYHIFAASLGCHTARLLRRAPFRSVTAERAHGEDRGAMDDLTRLVVEVAARHAAPDRAVTNADVELRDAGLESLELVALMVELEAELGISFPSALMDATTFRTPGSIARAVRMLRDG